MCEGGKLKENCTVCEHVVEGCIVRQPEMVFALCFQCFILQITSTNKFPKYENCNILLLLAQWKNS